MLLAITLRITLAVAFTVAITGFTNKVVAAECNLVKYSAHENYPPFHWYRNGEFYGITHDITKKLLSSYGVSYQAQPPEPWKRVLLNAKRGKVDLVLGLKNVKERQAYLSFTTAPLLNNPVSVFVSKGNEFELQSWDSLHGLAGNMNLGDRHGTEFDIFAKERLDIHRVKGLSANFEMLKMGRADFFITGYYTGTAYLEANRLTNSIVALHPYLLDGLIHFGFVKSSPCMTLKRKFNQDLLALQQSQEFEQILQKNMKLWREQNNPKLTIQKANKE